MTADIRKSGLPARPVTDPSTASLPGLASASVPPLPADAGLSAAFRQALGGRSGEAHIPDASSRTGREIARQAKADRPGAPHKGTARKTHIGPRSGHK